MNDTSLEQLVREYLDESGSGPPLDAYLTFFKRLKLPEAIRRAGYRPDGKIHDHQRLVGQKKVNQASEALLRNLEEIRKCKSFEQLHGCVERYTKRIKRFGRLARYDISLRIGACLDVRPECVYLHSGTKKGFKALSKLKFSGKEAKMEELPKPIQKLMPYHAENFLCIYRDYFGKSGHVPKSCSPRQGVC